MQVDTFDELIDALRALLEAQKGERRMITSYAVRDRSDGQYLDGEFNWGPQPFLFASRPDAYALIKRWSLGWEEDAERLEIVEVIDGVPQTRSRIILEWSFYFNNGFVTCCYECETAFCLLLYSHGDATIVIERAKPAITQEWFVGAFGRFCRANDIKPVEFRAQKLAILEAWNDYFA